MKAAISVQPLISCIPYRFPSGLPTLSVHLRGALCIPHTSKRIGTGRSRDTDSRRRFDSLSEEGLVD